MVKSLWAFLNSTLTPWLIVVLRTPYLFLSPFLFAVLGKHASHCTRYITNWDFTLKYSRHYPCSYLLLSILCMLFGRLMIVAEKKKKKKTFWLQILSFRLRSVKMEQRKLNDQANTLVDLAKVSLGSQPPYSHLLELTPAEKTVPLQEAAPPKTFNQSNRQNLPTWRPWLEEFF